MANITIRDVAKQAGVGVGTVSRVINRNPGVSDATRRKVLATIAELEYTPNAIAQRLSQGKTMSIAVLSPFLLHPSFIERLRGIESILVASNYDFMFYNVDTVSRREALMKNLVGSNRADGLLVMSLTIDDTDVAHFQKSKMPVVLIDSIHPALTHVVIDDVAGGYKATQHLIELGHQRIAYISDFVQRVPFNFRPVFDRFQGYCNALAEAGIELIPEYQLDSEPKQEKAHQLALDLLTLPNRPTAIFAYSDAQATGVLHAAQELNLEVPKDLSVVGYDDIEIAKYFNLTTVRQHLFESGVHGAELLLEAITDQFTEVKRVTLPTKLVVRDTTGPPAF